MKNEDLRGHMIEEDCPKCHASLLENKVNEKWCSMVGCDYGLGFKGDTLEYMDKTMKFALALAKTGQKERCEKILEDLNEKLKERRSREANQSPVS